MMGMGMEEGEGGKENKYMDFCFEFSLMLFRFFNKHVQKSYCCFSCLVNNKLREREGNLRDLLGRHNHPQYPFQAWIKILERN